MSSTGAIQSLDSPPSSPVEAGRFRSDIQGLRAVAVLLVVFFHANFTPFSGGYIGVDVFFVISGYVITAQLRRQTNGTLRERLVSFYCRRIRRIVPAATVVLVATVIASYAWLGAANSVPLLADVRWAAFFSANWHFIAVGSPYFVPGVQPSLVTQYWSLAVEEQFYIVFPFIVFGVTMTTIARRRPAVLAGVLIPLIIASSWWSIHLTSSNQAAAFYSPFTRFWELALGAVLTVIPSQWTLRRPQINAALGTVALLVLLVAASQLTSVDAYPGALSWWPCGATAVLLWTGQTRASWGPTVWLSWRPAQYVGNVSYGLYLWHYLWLLLPLEYATTPMSISSRVLQILAAFACAVVSFRFLENPIRRSHWLQDDHAATIMLLIICLLVTLNVTLIYRLV